MCTFLGWNSSIHVSAISQKFTVTNTNDSGKGSLRQAILDANANGNPTEMDIIDFAIAGQAESHVIAVQANLPILTEKVTIDGYSQPDAKPNTKPSPQPLDTKLRIEIQGPNASRTFGLRVAAGGSVIKGLAIYGFESTIVVNANDVEISGNFVNSNITGNENPTTLSYGTAINAEAGCSNLRIGGIDPAKRNVVLGTKGTSNSAGISSNCSNTKVYGNYIGLTANGASAIMGQTGLIVGSNLVGASSNTSSSIGGPNKNQRNVISGAEGSQVILFSEGNVVQGNFIGTDAYGDVQDVIINGAGVTVQANSRDNTIGGANKGEGNTIKGVKGSGVMVIDYYNSTLKQTLTPQKVAILGNTISSIGAAQFYSEGTGGMGIELLQIVDTNNPADYNPERINDLGPNKNDAGDSDSGANSYVNYPAITKAVLQGTTITLTYNLEAKGSPVNTYRVEFFSNDAEAGYPHGPGSYFIGAKNDVTPGKNLKATFTVDPNSVGTLMSATTTTVDPTTQSGFGATSEFAQNKVITSPADSDGDGTSDEIENGGPNGGDGNADRILDSQQSGVVTFENSQGVYSTIEETSCLFISQSTPFISKASDAEQSFKYPYELIRFNLNCAYKATAKITMRIFTEDSNPEFKLRTYSEEDGSSKSLPEQEVTQTTVAGQEVIQITYTLADGGDFDIDSKQNGVIVSSIGLALEEAKVSSAVSADKMILIVLFVIVALLLAFYISFHKYFSIKDYKMHRDPLISENPRLKYTYWHYIRVVSWPQMKYRYNDAFTRCIRKIGFKK